MTILFLIRLFYPHIGGVEKHVLEISKLLVEKGHSVTVLTEQYDNQLKKEDKIDGVKIIRIDNGKENWFKKFRIWRQLWAYRHLMKNADIVHCHDIFFWYLPFRFLYPSKKVFTTFHGYEGNKIPGFKSKLMHKIAEKLSKGNICVGDFLKKWYGTKPTFVTYGAVDLNKFKGKNSRNEAIFVGRLEEETGIMKYLEAMRLLKDKGINLPLIVLGEGSLENKAREYAKKNSLYVNLKGFVEDVEKYINSGRYIFVSRYLGILEAMAAKKPVFAVYNNDIKKDYLKMAPFANYISISKNAKDLSQNLIGLINRKKILDTDKGYAWIKDRTWDDMVSFYLRLWDIK
ncbi:MAG: glycosyltransferase family 4 protein [Patescibacteria group bacterium]|nr:glycosyltransferase family 4 protein [Patescibacteria group bacterium]